MKDKIKAFTLAETIIVLTILGVIAMITMPSLVKHQNEVAERTKLKKIWKMYDQVIQSMTIENGIRGEDALKEFAEANNCSNSAKYFRAAKYDQDGNYCVFKTNDDVWLDISDILHPTVTLDKNNNKTDNNTFTMVTRYDGSIRAFRTNDAGYGGLTKDEKAKLADLFSKINESTEQLDEPDQSRECSYEMKNSDGYYTSCTITYCPQRTCGRGRVCILALSPCHTYIYDSTGNAKVSTFWPDDEQIEYEDLDQDDDPFAHPDPSRTCDEIAKNSEGNYFSCIEESAETCSSKILTTNTTGSTGTTGRLRTTSSTYSTTGSTGRPGGIGVRIPVEEKTTTICSYEKTIYDANGNKTTESCSYVKGLFGPENGIICQ